MKYFFKKIGRSLIPANEETEKYFIKLRQNVVVSAEFKTPRNYEHHKKFFAFLAVVLNNQEAFKTTKQLLDAIKLDVGCVEIYKDIKGNVYQKPGSISFESMCQEKFNKFYSKAVDCVLANLLICTTPEEIHSEVETYLSFS